MKQRAAQPQLLLHPTRQLSGRMVAKWRQIGTVQQFGNTHFSFGFAMVKETGEKINALIDR